VTNFASTELVQSEYFGRSISSGVLQPESIRSISSGLVIGMAPFDVIRASVKRPNDKCLLAWAYIPWTSPTSLN